MSDADQTVDGSIPGHAAGTPAPPATGAAVEPLVFPVSGWDRYEFTRLLGHGGMGSVWEARDLRLGRPVALKFIRGADPKLTMRLLNEARAQARIEHAGVCKVYEAGEVQGRAYIAMQLIAGRPLGEAALELSLHEKVQLIRDAAIALHEAHVLGILHRDVKPANLLVERAADGTLHPVLVDFGLARQEDAERGLTQSGALVGTPAYMPPEQARGEQHLDRRADVYSLGATLYEILGGAPPFKADTVVNVVLAVISDEPRRLRALDPDLPQDLETIVAKAMAKEPGQRYDSAKALAEDLDRYIRGEPILGRRTPLGYRLRRWAAKRRALVWTAALSLAAIAVTGAFALRERVLLRRKEAGQVAQLRAAREIAQDVKEMEWFLRAAHLLPRHDLRREEREVRDRMARMERVRLRTEAGGAGAGLADYAIGRGHLALHEDEPARARFAAAAQQGIDLPELHFGLGVALGRLYERAMAETARGGDPRWIERRRKEIEAQYLAPALAAMERSRAAQLEAPSYLDGLIAYYRKDWDAALKLAARARGEAPWMYEAGQLAADVHLARGVERKDRGNPDGADADLRAAGQLYDEAAEIGRSDASLYLGAAEAWIRRMEIDTFRGRNPAPHLATAVERCARAATVRPDLAAPHQKTAYAHGFVVEYRWNRGEDPRPAILEEAAAARRALALDERDFAAWERLGAGSFRRADWELRHGVDPRAALDEAVSASRRATEVDPRHPWGHLALGNALHLRGSYAISAGLDPSADLEAASAEYAAAVRFDPDYTAGYANRLWTLSFMVRERAARGGSPVALRSDGEACFAACLRSNPGWALCYENQGALELRLAEYAALATGSVGAELGRATAHLEKAAALDPQYVESRQLLAEAHLLAARVAPTEPAAREAIAAADRELAHCRRLAAHDPGCRLDEARLRLLAAQHVSSGAARSALSQAGALAAEAVAADPRSADALAVYAATRRALAATAEPAARRRLRREGLAACARGLAIDPVHAELRIARSALLVDEARDARATARIEAAQAAIASLDAAFARNPLLRRQHGPLLDEARRLAASAAGAGPAR